MDDTPQTLLHKIWTSFTKAQYVDDQEIIEYIAYLLTKGSTPLNEKLRAEKPRNRYGIEDKAISKILSDASALLQDEGGAASFFDRYVLFHSTRVRSKGTYPTPRHIVDFMIDLLQVRPEDNFADFTCGTGGFLVKRDGLTNEHPGATFGIEIAPELARIAHSNALLHGFQRDQITIEVGNAFNVCARSEWSNHQFDRIAMAPPFGESIDVKLAEQLLADVKDRSSELLFTRLALQKLTDEGQAIIMVPPGLGYTNASSELRKELIEQHTLKAVISLGENIIQPFTPTPVYLLLFANSKATMAQPIWFVDITYDGYPLNRSRDLTIKPSPNVSNDLPLAKVAILPPSKEHPDFQIIPQQPLTEASNDPVLYIRSFSNIPGVVLKVHNDATLTHIRLFQGSSKGIYLLVEAVRRDHSATYTLIPLATASDLATIRNISDTLAWRREYFETPRSIRDEEVQDGTYIFGGGTSGQMIAITSDGRLLGFTKQPHELAETQYELTDRYRRVHAELIASTTNTAMMLQEIHIQQQTIGRYVDNLLGQLEVKHIIGQPLPPPLLTIDNFTLIDELGTEQQAIWCHIVDNFTIDDNYALYFLPDQLPAYIQRRVHIDQTLQLLERLGLIVQVAIKHPRSGSIITCYRRSTILDHKQWKELEREQT